ncbi:exo-alpha-sialidase [Chlamydiifrater phoenicopteri]|uniref:exo-alpha-sialidase n=1 Tax=Chlamydiifrater phoenicopteri TaxID=2681469 RepID=UPI001BCF3B99|nr:exo-alpha-sialidase [Chlamydiifrater phoenicopteri]
MFCRCFIVFFIALIGFFREVSGEVFWEDNVCDEEECILSSESTNSDKASIVDLGGRLLVVWEEDCSVKRLVAKEYVGGIWKDLMLPFKSEKSSHSNPILAKISSKEIILFYEKQREGSSHSCAKISSSGGRLWGEEKILPPGILGSMRNAPLVKRSLGMMYLPVYACYPYSKKLTTTTSVWLEVVDIKLRKWKGKRGPVYSTSFDKQPKEPSLVSLGDDSLLLVCRNHAGSSYDTGASILFSRSFDEGKSWSEVETSPWPNPDTSVTAVYGMNTLFVFANNSLIGPQNLSCFSISDIETQWNEVKEIEKGFSENPSAVLTSDGYVHIVYTVKINGKKRIKYKKLSSRALISGDAVFVSEIFD